MSEVYFNDYRDYIHLEYQVRKSRRTGYSMRAFARDLKFSPSSLNDFIKGRVGMSEARIENLAKSLNWSQLRKEYFKDLIFSKFAKEKEIRSTSKMRVKLKIQDKNTYYNLQQLSILNKWYNFVIIEIFEIQDHISAKEIAKKLNLNIKEVNQSIKNLLNVNSIIMTEKGYKPTQSFRQSGSDQPSDIIKHLHDQILQLAKNALYAKNMNERESQSLIFSIISDDMKKMNYEVLQAMTTIINKYAVDVVADSVQVISFQSFQVFKKG